MIYFEKHRDGSISKWNITFDIDDLEIIKKQVMEKFHKVIHHEHDLDEDIAKARLESKKYHNFTMVKNLNSETYHVTYDEYEYPRLVYLIEDLLCGDLSAISSIESPTETGQRKYNERIETLADEIDTIDNFDTDKKIRKLEELKVAIRESNINKSEKKLSKYYEMTQSVINRYLIAHLEPEEVENIESFFDMSIPEIVKAKQRRIF
ncbi:MAG: hypothetical protein II119_01775 [Bacilli bacterium]|nr:hypothetical protein [Bacilli bacterium]MBQ6282458.1 hypothetical protein [Bacilli bacterium]